MEIVAFIKKLEGINALSKHEQIVTGIIDAIATDALVVGSKLPSINVMVEQTGFARKTIVKAYEELKEKGLVASKKTKGYFVVSNNTHVFLKIALVLYSFQRFQQEFYNALRDDLKEKVEIDVFFHHNSEAMLGTILANIQGKYGKYVIAPIESGECREMLLQFPPEKLILVDRYVPLGKDYTYIVQEFKNSTISILESLKDKLLGYKNINLFYTPDKDYPKDIYTSFKKFCVENQISYSIVPCFEAAEIALGQVYFTISDADLWPLLKTCQERNLRLGEDIGIISFNDHIVKELVSGGVTTISTNFKEMAHITANIIKNNTPQKVYVPTDLILRESI